MPDAETSFALTLRKMRKAGGLTQDELAEKRNATGCCRYHQTTITKIEAGDRAITLNDVAAAAAALGVRVADLIDGDLTAAVSASDRRRALDRQRRQRIAADILRGAALPGRRSST